ncbi:MAG: DNA N-6-adenine-methyltransferase (Dam) [Tenericutes bacterium ADurb.Bin024]|nr:MAG: DNA N-6-adenine-methyltransferase (Dam) [Tenericutes bacterium ADurb.Bin024]
MIVKIHIDNEFKNLIPPLTNEEYKGLEESILKEGCRDSLVTWNGTLIDGHNRYEICTKHNIPFETVEHNFDSRQAVIEWIILNQFGRRNLPAHERARLALRLKPVIAERAKEKEEERKKTFQKSEKSNLPEYNTAKEIAKVAGVSHDTIAKVETIEYKAPEPVVMASRKGDISVNSAYEVTKLEPQEQKEIAHRIEHIAEEPKGTSTPKAIVQEVLKRPHVANNSGNNEWYTPAEFIEAAVDVMGCIDLDPASNPIANKVVKAEKYYTAEENGLDKTWSGNVWLNPPYASDLIGKFADKLLSERKNYTQAIVLVNNATETEWFNKIVSIASAVCFPKSRVKFYMPDGKTGAPLQGQAVLYIGENASKFTEVFCKLGWCCNVIH